MQKGTQQFSVSHTLYAKDLHMSHGLATTVFYSTYSSHSGWALLNFFDITDTLRSQISPGLQY